jgi:hypothetical protein
VHGVIADTAGGAWSFGGSILTFAFPMILFIVVAAALYVAYTKPELVPGRRVPASAHPMTYTTVPGQPAADGGKSATGSGEKAPGAPGGPVAPGEHEPEGGE